MDVYDYAVSAPRLPRSLKWHLRLMSSHAGFLENVPQDSLLLDSSHVLGAAAVREEDEGRNLAGSGYWSWVGGRSRRLNMSWAELGKRRSCSFSGEPRQHKETVVVMRGPTTGRVEEVSSE
jgi:hypothetical protein